MRSGLVSKVLLMFFVFFPGIENIAFSQLNPKEKRMAEKVMEDISPSSDLFRGWNYLGRMEVDSVAVDQDNERVEIYFSPHVVRIPVRHVWLNHLKYNIRNNLRRRFRDYSIEFYCNGRPMEDYIPLYYYNGVPDSLRMKSHSLRQPLAEKISEPDFPAGLSNNNIALWASHGYYYEAKLDRWEWQRARLFGTVEDIYPFMFTRNFLVPMLEDAGATVFLSRERDIQVNEVIVDNDRSTGDSELVVNDGNGQWIESDRTGFAPKDTLFPGENPFTSGAYLKMEVSREASGTLQYIPEIPEKGEYAVYISWGKEANALTNVPCIVNHSGGQTRFSLNQQMGYATWVYLGTFHFQAGKNPGRGSVTIVTPKNSIGVVSADAVRFGGGMGNVARRPAGAYIPRQWSLKDGQTDSHRVEIKDFVRYTYKLSGKPRWMEAGRYQLQYAGMPDSIVYSLNDNENDYNDDYQSRGEWVNYLMGRPNGPTGTGEEVEGLNIPVDLAFAFHTDAGTTPGDSVIGTLGIYSSERDDGMFPDGTSRLASRDLTDMIQSQIVSDVRLGFKADWTRRAMWDRQYSEAWRPNVPTMLLELLSHQNPADMKYGLDPRFQFAVARAIYKGMARFLAAREGRQVIIKPLPPDNMALEIVDGKKIKISWSPVKDPLEPSAVPSGYKVYQRIDNNGFDNGIYTTDTSLVIEVDEYETIYSFKVSALNEGGQSFPGETLAVSLNQNSDDPVLIVNGFDRVAPPAFADGNITGVAWWEDEGVPWHRDMSHVGRQYDYDRSSPWLDDDSPGNGASYADMEGKVIPGNNFDFVFCHGQAIRDAGYSFVSVSDEVFAKSDFNVTPYFAVDLIYGEERGTPALFNRQHKDYRVLTPGVQENLERFVSKGGNVLISGAYIGTDAVENNDTVAIGFAEAYLHYRWMTNHADNTGELMVTDKASALFMPSLSYNAGYHPHIYKVEAPDGIEPAGDGAFRIFRYTAGKVSAGVAYSGSYRSVALGFPFEAVPDKEERNKLMKDILKFFQRD
ncbi:MAG: hypothetical protein PWQ17_375 [Anaerophaga sp.]|nr:hypothetical protein [Anaerophaga sp.]